MVSQKVLLISIIGLTVLAGIFSVGKIENQDIVLEAGEVEKRDNSIPEEVVERYIRWRSEYKPTQNTILSNYRLSIFWENLKQIERVNNNPMSTYESGLNQFSDLTDEEFIETFLGINMYVRDTEQYIDESIDFLGANATVNWTAAGAVNSPPNQQSCGSCWAFSTIAVVEGYTFLKTGELPQLSQQQLVDCATTYWGNLGCQGGNIYPSLGYILQYGITTVQAYPYIASQQSCKFEGGQYKISSRQNNNGCQNLINDLQTQPTGVYVDASNWKNYKTGVFNNCGTKLNHGVIATGYDSNKNWIIRNSWGTTWGDNGYMTLQGGASTCGICSNLSNAY